MVAKVRVRRRKRGNVPKPITGPTKVHVGFPSGDSDSDIVARAIWNHFGTSRGIPARPFMFNAIRGNKRNINRFLKKVAPDILKGEMSTTTALSQLGILTQGYIQEEITALRSPPNAESTIRRKSSSNPLIDTGEMRGAVTYKVMK